MSNPWFKFYPTDWRQDPKLRICGLEARGLWIEMIALMHQATPYGHLLVSGQPPTDMQLAMLVGCAPDQITRLVGEMETAGVFSRTRTGVIYSRKMSRMQKKAATARNNGKKGGNPSLGKERENPALDNLQDNPKDKPQKPEARSHIDIGGGGDAGANAALTHREKLIAAMGIDPSRPIVSTSGKSIGGQADMLEAGRWASLGITESEQVAVIAEITASKRGGPPNSFKYFTPAMQRFAADKASAKTPLTPIDGGINDQRTARNAPPANGRPNRVDPALEQIARLAGLGSAPGYGGS